MKTYLYTNVQAYVNYQNEIKDFLHFPRVDVKDIEQACGMSRSYLSRMHKRKTEEKLGVQKLKKFSDMLDITMNDLLYTDLTEYYRALSASCIQITFYQALIKGSLHYNSNKVRKCYKEYIKFVNNLKDQYIDKPKKIDFDNLSVKDIFHLDSLLESKKSEFHSDPKFIEEINKFNDKLLQIYKEKE